MAKTSHGEKLWPFPMYFEPISGQKYGFQGQHFPCELRADLYVFGIRGTRRMGPASELIQNQTFQVFAPPLYIPGDPQKSTPFLDVNILGP